MKITSIRAKNFKSFRELAIDLGDLNVLIGANASGKSNFVQLFAFIRDIVESGLENAISIQGGAQYLRNMNCADDDPIAIDISFQPTPDDPIIPFIPDHGPSRVLGCRYRFSVVPKGAWQGSVVEDELHVERRSDSHLAPSETFRLMRVDGRFDVQGLSVLGEFLSEHLRSRSPDVDRPRLLIEDEVLRSMLPINGVKSFGIYDVDSRRAKSPVLFGGKRELQSDAHNLALVLEMILSNESDRRKLLNLLRDVLYFADDLSTEPHRDRSLLFNMRERFSHLAVPASFLSDGTIDVIALIVILYFERKSFVVIEEPERNLHPSLISRIVELFKDASQTKQIVLSTHSAEIVRYVDPQQLILISRDSSGFSHAERPADKAQVQQFLRDEISMDELYVQNLLEA